MVSTVTSLFAVNYELKFSTVTSLFAVNYELKLCKKCMHTPTHDMVTFTDKFIHSHPPTHVCQYSLIHSLTDLHTAWAPYILPVNSAHSPVTMANLVITTHSKVDVVDVASPQVILLISLKSLRLQCMLLESIDGPQKTNGVNPTGCQDTSCNLFCSREQDRKEDWYSPRGLLYWSIDLCCQWQPDHSAVICSSQKLESGKFASGL